MALTKVQIFNLALSRIGTRSSVSDVDENSEEAARLRAVYDHVRDTVLGDHPWPFATIYQALSVTGETDSLWLYQYRYPLNCLNFIGVMPQSWFSDTTGVGLIFSDYSNAIRQDDRYRQPPRIPFEVGLSSDRTQRVILTNEPEAIGRFVVQVTNELLFPGLFTDALAWKLAREAAPSLTGSDSKVEALERMYQLTLGTAKAASNEESLPRDPIQPSSVRARY